MCLTILLVFRAQGEYCLNMKTIFLIHKASASVSKALVAGCFPWISTGRFIIGNEATARKFIALGLACLISACTIHDGAEVTLIRDSNLELEKTAADIGEAIRKDPELRSYSIRYNLNRYRAFIEGQVPHEADRAEVEQIFRQYYSGRIENNLQLIREMNGDELIRRIRAALTADDVPDVYNIDITTQGGVVHLAGSRPSHRDVDRILSIVLNVPGVDEAKAERLVYPK